MSQQTIFFGRFIDTPAPDELRIRTGAVLVSSKDGHGTITKMAFPASDPNDAASQLGIEAPIITSQDNGFFFPGFIDTHIHASQYPNAGIFGKSTLLDWLTTYTFPLESSLSNPDSPMYTKSTNSTTTPPNPLSRARTVYSRIISTTLSHGTTTASYYATISVPATNILSTLAHQRGQRAYIGRVCMDNPATCPSYYRDPDTATTIAHEKSHISYTSSLDPTGQLLAPIITPRFAPSCTPTTLSAHAQLSEDHNLRIQTHISENLNELALVAQLFPEQSSYAEVYDVHKLLTPRTILAHAVHLSTAEIQTIKVRGSKISHCPASNSALGSGFCPVRVLLDAGLDVGLGTDVSGGYSASILEAVRQACLVSRQVGFIRGGDSKHNLSVTEGLWLGTVGGARCVGMEGKLGVFEEGVLWDVQEVDLEGVVKHEEEGEMERVGGIGPVDIFGWEDWEERVAKWVWNGDDRNVRRVWVGGRLVHERR